MAFDPDRIVQLVSLDKLAGMAGDESPAVRQLVATILSQNAEPKWTDTLIKLVQDTDPEVARQAAPGLGKIGEPRAREPLVAALKNADKDSRNKFLEALRDGIGTDGLVLALNAVSTDDQTLAYYQKKQIFDMIDKLNDPRGGNALYAYLESKPHMHFQTRAATALAQIGDIRGVPTLAKRLRMDPLKLYTDQNDWEMMLKRDDNERVVASRMLADLAMLLSGQASRQICRAGGRRSSALRGFDGQMPSAARERASFRVGRSGMRRDDIFRRCASWANPPEPHSRNRRAIAADFPQDWATLRRARFVTSAG